MARSDDELVGCDYCPEVMTKKHIARHMLYSCPNNPNRITTSRPDNTHRSPCPKCGTMMLTRTIPSHRKRAHAADAF